MSKEQIGEGKRTLYKGFLTVEKDLETGYEIINATDSIAVLIHVVDQRTVILISQPRTPMKTKENPEGISHEMPAGRFDIEIGTKALMVKEVWEEARAKITEDAIFLLNDGKPVSLSPGILTEVMYLGYAEITSLQMEEVPEGMLLGLAEEHEKITRKLIPIHELRSMVFDNMTAMLLVQWFLYKNLQMEIPMRKARTK